MLPSEFWLGKNFAARKIAIRSDMGTIHDTRLQSDIRTEGMRKRLNEFRLP